ncbi:pectinesterase family protein [Aliiglaciecola lipolytica]|uniref:Pectinesterase n=1 Tax=Aliiglaciecola lipolytica E3 TaxID=1127673 RepID=K6Y8D9_9ALTE|nr:pectinesterase family protein [Aliiglaciecola lipolytica]GAC14472.1 pectinesterase/pectinesterase inhibitor PPE8B [Aliiglaciecola lipolytica E3]
MKSITFFLFALFPMFIGAQGYQTQFTVAKDGSGDFTRIQDAIYATKTYPWTDITIFIKNGIYQEKVEIYAWNTRLRLVGESREGTVIRYEDHFNKINKGRNSTFHTFTLRVLGNDFSAENLTIENTAGPVGQAVALHVEADRARFSNISLKGFQDTLYVAGEGFRTYFHHCYIEGSTDFIFGQGTAVFENCEIKSLTNSFITAASTPQDQPFGLVFKHCKLTAEAGVNEVYLGRPWRQYAKTVFLDSQIGKHIHPAGWHDWDKASNHSTVFYAEYQNSGEGADMRRRVSWSQQLSAEQAKQYATETILRGWDPAN